MPDWLVPILWAAGALVALVAVCWLVVWVFVAGTLLTMFRGFFREFRDHR